MHKFLNRIKSNIAEVENDETGMEVIQAVLLIVVAVAFVAVLFLIGKRIMENGDEGAKKQINQFNEWAESY